MSGPGAFDEDDLRLFLVRHGSTPWSRSGQHTGRTDIPLDEEGREQARALRPALAALKPRLVLTSPLQRARETCELAGFGKIAEIADDLREWDYGAYEGLTSAEIHATRPDWDLFRDGCPDGEQPTEIAARVDALLATVRAGDAGTVICFAHGHVLRVLAARFVGADIALSRHLVLDAAHIATLDTDRGLPVLRMWNVGPEDYRSGPGEPQVSG